MPASLLSHVLLDGPGTAAFLCAPLEARSDLFQVQESLMQTKRGWCLALHPTACVSMGGGAHCWPDDDQWARD